MKRIETRQMTVLLTLRVSGLGYVLGYEKNAHRRTAVILLKKEVADDFNTSEEDKIKTTKKRHEKT